MGKCAYAAKSKGNAIGEVNRAIVIGGAGAGFGESTGGRDWSARSCKSWNRNTLSVSARPSRLRR